MDNNLKKKLENEEKLTVADTFALDQALEEQAVLQTMVHDLEEEGASLAWRSRLNEKLIATSAPVKPRNRWTMFRIWAPVSAGVACLAVLGVFLMKPMKSAPQSEGTVSAQELEREMLAAHFGSGIAVEYHSGVVSEPTGEPVETQTPTWSSEDLEMF